MRYLFWRVFGVFLDRLVVRVAEVGLCLVLLLLRLNILGSLLVLLGLLLRDRVGVFTGGTFLFVLFYGEGRLMTTV